ncbi:unnamed protein product [Brassica oleracea var. botrytis]
MGVPHHLLFSLASPPLFSPEWVSPTKANRCLPLDFCLFSSALVDVKNICVHGNELKRTREMNRNTATAANFEHHNHHEHKGDEMNSTT